MNYKMFKLLNVLYMIYMFNIFVLRNLTPLLGNVALRMGNLQVTRISCGREWTPHKCVLGALIRNEMGLCLLFLFLTYYLWIFMNKCWTRLEIFMMRSACQRLFVLNELIPLRSFEIIMLNDFWRLNCYLSIYEFLRSVAFRLKLNYSDF